jgi:hypothetical protein
MSINTKSMFDAIKQSLSSAKNEGGGGNVLYKEILKFTAGNTYQVRLVPNPQAPKESIFHHYTHGWNSNVTGKYVTAMCPTTFGDTCPIDAYYLKTYRNGTESEKEAAKILSRKEGWLVNVYVISDPSNPENEGKVKILRYGRELAKIIESALDGDDADEFGVEKVFDVLGGSTLRIKCENRTEKGRGATKMVTYASSKFLSPSVLDISEDEVNTIHQSVHDLKAVNKPTTRADMQRLLDEHFFGLVTGSTDDSDDSEQESNVKNATRKPAEPIENIFNEIEANFGQQSSFDNSPATQVAAEADETTDEALKKLLADL